MTIQKLSIQNLLLVGFTLFSMFFGAGNLIFPPDLAARAGAQVIPAMAGFLISAVGLPVLGVAAVAVSGGLEKLAGKVGGRFSLLFTLTAYLAIGPFLAIPRTASTSFEMTLLPVLSVPILIAIGRKYRVFYGEDESASRSQAVIDFSAYIRKGFEIMEG